MPEDQPLDNRGLYGFTGHDDPDSQPLSVENVTELVNEFLFNACELRGQQATGQLTGDEVLAELTQQAENLEAIFYGNVAGWRGTNWWDEKGLGYHLAQIQGQNEVQGQVTKLLLYAAAQLFAHYDKSLTDPTYLGMAAAYPHAVDTTATWFHGVPPHVRAGKAAP